MKLLAPLKSAAKWVYEGMEGIGDAEIRLLEVEVDRKPIMWVSHARSLIKSVSWRFFGTLISFLVIYGITHKGKLAFIVSGVEAVVKIALYYFHERVWNKVAWGRE